MGSIKLGLTYSADAHISRIIREYEASYKGGRIDEAFRGALEAASLLKSLPDENHPLRTEVLGDIAAIGRRYKSDAAQLVSDGKYREAISHLEGFSRLASPSIPTGGVDLDWWREDLLNAAMFELERLSTKAEQLFNNADFRESLTTAQEACETAEKYLPADSSAIQTLNQNREAIARESIRRFSWRTKEHYDNKNLEGALTNASEAHEVAVRYCVNDADTVSTLAQNRETLARQLLAQLSSQAKEQYDRLQFESALAPATLAVSVAEKHLPQGTELAICRDNLEAIKKATYRKTEILDKASIQQSQPYRRRR